MHEPSMPEAMSSSDLVKELTSDASLLVKRQIELAKLEAKEELKKGVVMASMLGAAGVCAYAGLILLLVAAAMAIGAAINGWYWLGALIVAGGMFVFAGITGGIGYARRLKQPLKRSRAELSKEITWARYRTT